MRSERWRRGASLVAAAMLCAVLAGCGAKFENPADIPIGSDEWQGMTAEEVIGAFETAGFTNIQENKKETSSADDVGKITKISVDGTNLFRAGDRHEGSDAVEITYYEMRQFEAEMEIEVSVDAGLPVFEVNTNLPNGTILKITLEDGEKYSEEQTAKVESGKASSSMFWENGNYLEGDYQLSIIMEPCEQNASVKHELGENGETLTGALVREDEENGGQYLYLEESYTSDYEAPEKAGEDEVVALLELAAASGFGENYDVSVDGNTFVVNVWQDGAAETAALAAQGVPTAVEEWYTLADSACAASEGLQAVLTSAGYGECVAVLQVLNDQNLENTLLTACMGAETYNCVG